MGEMGGVYQVLDWMTGESLFTHQLPRVSREATPVVLELHPELQEAITEAEQITTENFSEWRTTWETRYGMTISVPKMTIGEHERIDALSELAEKVHPDRIIGVLKRDPLLTFALSLLAGRPLHG